jgi:hypothetical protein
MGGPVVSDGTDPRDEGRTAPRRRDPHDPRLAWPNARFLDELDGGDLPLGARDEDDDDEPAPRDARERAFLVQQRIAHGLLRALDQDAESRERRIDRILERVTGRASSPGRTVGARGPRPYWRRVPAPFVAAAALVVALVASVVFAGRSSLPRADALIASVQERLSESVDRRYAVRFEASLVDDPSRSGHWTGELIASGGGRFVLEGHVPRARWSQREFRIGSDGKEFWFERGLRRGSKPLAEAERLNDRLGFFLDAGQLQLDDLLARLPERCRLVTTDRLPPTALGGAHLLRVEGRGLPRFGRGGVEEVVLLVDEETRLVQELATSVRGPGGHGRFELRLTLLGEIDEDPTRYGRPF